ncbi:cytochrome b5 reductase 4 [Musca vetustissima]|uniref:cytochrome b5 reductase 4 n=1 Tax=Musca vetustissima TaxID=27455 RepID=UPI002AB7D8D8|nr:cytochrome b5 reductase 4 [Musca vetustissima]
MRCTPQAALKAMLNLRSLGLSIKCQAARIEQNLWRSCTFGHGCILDEPESYNYNTTNMSNKTTNNLLAPSSPTSLMIPQTPPNTGSGSATGNPRNKCALKPGHSLMDWIRLGNSGVDLAGTKGRIIPVTPEELAKHNTRNDAWMAIRGVVYNVTRYMDFHPGGVDELMRGVGKDATKLFNEVHAWVNYQQLLNKCLIGPLKHSKKVEKVLEVSTNDLSPKFTRPPLPPATQDVVPRLDWIQNRNSLTLYFYTKQFCNPGSLIRKVPERPNNHIEISILIDNYIHKYEFELHAEIKWPPKDVKMNTESGKLECSFEKPEERKDLWPQLGKQQVQKVLKNSVEDELLMDFKTSLQRQYNHNSFVLVLNSPNVIYTLPLGYHVSLECLINSRNLSKCYTPIPSRYLKDDKDLNNCGDMEMCNLNFLIKKYTHPNSFSGHLSSLTNDMTIRVSIPKGNFKLSKLAGHRNICFLAAGSGLTPFLPLIDHLLKRNTNRIELLNLLYFNRTSEDIWCHDMLSNIAKNDERFEFTNILSNPDASWTGAKGHVSSELLAPLLDKSKPDKITFISACGPSGYNTKVEEILQELEFPKENLFIF